MEEPLVYSIEDAARLLGISRTKAYHLARMGRLRTIPLGRRQVVPASALEALLWTSLTRPTDGVEQAAEDVNRIEVVGRLTRDAEIRQTKHGRPLCLLRLAIRRRPGDDAVFIDVVAFGEAAEHAATLGKGELVWVGGRLDQRGWTTEDGSHRQAHQIVVQYLEVRTGRRCGQSARSA
jgi:excisionase family DNA binding protein